MLLRAMTRKVGAAPTSSNSGPTRGETHTSIWLPAFITPPASICGREALIKRTAAKAKERTLAIGNNEASSSKLKGVGGLREHSTFNIQHPTSNSPAAHSVSVRRSMLDVDCSMFPIRISPARCSSLCRTKSSHVPRFHFAGTYGGGCPHRDRDCSDRSSNERDVRRCAL